MLYIPMEPFQRRGSRYKYEIGYLELSTAVGPAAAQRIRKRNLENIFSFARANALSSKMADWSFGYSALLIESVKRT